QLFPLGVLPGAVGHDDTVAGSVVPRGRVLADGVGGVPRPRDRVCGKSGKSSPLPPSRRLAPIAENLRA
ncbi:MAG: hypothetical protein NT154_04360, partial [Verrucomicrobia bacterium]|nr:hypothetical protein [Verrucomicrobiota bacterium]